MEKTTERQKFGIRDIMTIAAMMVITFLVAMIIGSFTLPFPAVYLYGSAGIDAFICVGRSLWPDSRRHGLYVPNPIFPGGGGYR